MHCRSFGTWVVAAVMSVGALFATPAAFAQAAAPASSFIQGLSDQFIQIVAQRGNPQQEVERFSAIFAPAIDMDSVAPFVLGRFWRQATPQQQADFKVLFRDLNVLVWSQRFNEYNGETLNIRSERVDGERTIVVSEIRRPRGRSIPVEWAVHQVNGSYRIVDITVEGVSMAITNRSDYAAAIQSQGGIDGLLAMMRQRINTMRTQRGLR